MKLAATMGTNARPPSVELARSLERAGYHSFWTAEDWGLDAVSPLAWVGSHTTSLRLGTSIMQVPGRTPGLTAMTAATMANMSAGRFILGLGPSGPQVAEGWHGVPYGKPLSKLREYVDLVRRALERGEPLTHEGEYYQLPYRGPGATGPGKPLRLNTRADYHVPIYVTAMGPTALATGAEIADGVIATMVDGDRIADLEAAMQPGLDASGRTRDAVALVVFAAVAPGDDVAACIDAVRPSFARMLGGYGAKGRNFYHDQISRMGWAAEADRVQELYLAGRRDEAAAAIPDELIDSYSLVGPPARIAQRLGRYERADIVMLGTGNIDLLEAIAAQVS